MFCACFIMFKARVILCYALCSEHFSLCGVIFYYVAHIFESTKLVSSLVSVCMCNFTLCIVHFSLLDVYFLSCCEHPSLSITHDIHFSLYSAHFLYVVCNFLSDCLIARFWLCSFQPSLYDFPFLCDSFSLLIIWQATFTRFFGKWYPNFSFRVMLLSREHHWM